MTQNLDEVLLDTKIQSIKKVFNTDKIIALKPLKKDVQRYYKVNKIPYSIFHTKSDSIHMGISRDGNFKEEDLLGAAKIIEKYILQNNAAEILELATGRGANSFYLAKQFPEKKFYGIDISESQLSFARKNADKVKNYYPTFTDYHDLSRFADQTIDIVFELESLCYSSQKERVLVEVQRVLKKDGLFITFDGYFGKKENEISDTENLARNLVEKGMAVYRFEDYQSYIQKAKQLGFQVIYEENLSAYVVPTMKRFESLADKFFKHPYTARLLTRLLPEAITYNAAAGYLMPTVMDSGLFCYMLTVVKKV